MKKVKNNTHRMTILLLLCLSVIKVQGQEQVKFSTINEAFALAKNKNYTLVNAELQIKIADLTKKAAVGNVFNPRVPTTIQALDNMNQQVSFLPAEAFGGPAGTFKEVTIGQQYVSTLAIMPQFEIFNLSNIAQVKSAKINEQLVDNQNKLNELQLYNKINSIYSNILSFNGQKEILQENLKIAENIQTIIKQKFDEGLVRKQDVNEAEVNVISTKDKIEQLEVNLKIQYQLLNLFFENQTSAEVTESIWNYENSNQMTQVKNNLDVENTHLQNLLAKQEYKSLKYQNLPSLSFVSSFSWHYLSNESFFHSTSNNTNFNYLGLKLNLELPTAQRLANTKNKSIQIKMLSNTEEHSIKENDLKNQQLLLDYEKAVKQAENYKKIVSLKKDTYDKNYNQFKENILSLDKLLISQNELLQSKLNEVLALANISFNKNKIDINNKF
ncbi:MAG: TolC family protein [Bacteroidetes bacterium]|nr:TolC family protein [Bacteroidota bacterium]